MTVRTLLLTATLPLTLLVPCVAAAATYGPSGLNYSYDIRVDGPTLAGTGAITVRNDGPQAMPVVWVRLWGNGGWGCNRPVVRVRVTGGGRADGLMQACTALRIRLDAPIAPGDSSTVHVALRARVPTDHFRTGSWGRVHSFGGVLPTVAPTVDGRFDLDRYIAIGDPWLLLVGSWHVRLATPRGVTVGTSGVAQGDLVAPSGWVRREYVNDTAREFNVVSGPLGVAVGDADGVPVRVLYGPGTPRRAAVRLVGTARRAISAFAARYGPYPGRHLDVLLAGPSGMEYPSLVISEPTAPTLVHEVAHQWFSQEVGSDGWKEPWIDETMATYAQMRLLGLTADCSLTNPLGAYRPARLSWTLAQFARYPDRLYDAVYDGGACALAGIAHDIGGAAFDTLLGDWVAAHQWGVVTTGEFLNFLRTRIPDATMARFLATTGLG